MYKYILYLVLALLTIQLSAQWSPTAGPGGGTINCIYETNGTYYTAAGAIYSSSDGGLNWVIKNKGLPLIAKVNTIYGDEDYLYAGLTQFGVFRSDDHGDSWEEINNGLSETGNWVRDLYAEDGLLYAAVEQQGVYISSDQGNNWILKNNGLEGAALRVASIMVYNDTLFAATPLGAYRFENDGDLWIPSSSGIPVDKVYSIDIVKNDNNLFVAVLDGIFRSSDAGLNWTRVGDGIFNTGVYSITVFGNDLYAGTNGRVYYSSDEGNTWTEIGSGVTIYSYIYDVGVNENSLICGVNQRGIFKYNPENDLWNQSNAGLINENVADMMVDGNDMIAVTVRMDFGQIFKTGNNGVDWTMWNNGGWDGGYNALINTGNYYLAGTDGGYLYRSSNKGENWELISYPEFPTSYVSGFCMKDQVVLAASFGNVRDAFRSVDEGAVWEACNLPGDGNVMALLATDQYVFAGRTDGVFRSEDLGLTWIHTSNGMSELPFIKRLAANEEYIFAAANDGLYRSPDQGENWEKIYNPPFSESIESIATHEDYLFAGAKQLGLMYSDDNGETWEITNPDYFQDPAGIYPTVIAIETKGDSLYASYQDFSVWVRPLPNITGIEDEQDLGFGMRDDLKINPNPVIGISAASYTLQTASFISLKMYDMFGRVRAHFLNETQSAGRHVYNIDGDEFEQGVYIVILNTGDTRSFQKILIEN